ncbi:MAG: NHLP leader peptide family RiPP precursor [Nostoc sp.]|uniref:NHLP leader peptide family RiPP precursor n=1 Tax=Nostoc sp. TaxID=1180 RepID=UPI002FFA6C92
MANQIKSYEALIERLWADEQLKNNFIANPKLTLSEMDIDISDAITVEAHEDSLEVKNLVLPLESKLKLGNLARSDYGFKAVIERAWQDEYFKTELLQNPRAAIKKVIGTDLPDTLIICVYEDTQTIKHLVVPVNSSNEELNELDLMLVAGGISGIKIIEPTIGLIALPESPTL